MVVSSVPAQAVIIDPGAQAWVGQVHGSFLQVGNGVLKCGPTAPPASPDPCSRMHTGIPTASNADNTNDNNRMICADVDGVAGTYIWPLQALPTGSAQTHHGRHLWTPQGVGCFGGWALQIVYDYGDFVPGNLDSTLKQVFQFDGHVRQFQGDSKIEVTLDNLTPQGSGAKAGLVASRVTPALALKRCSTSTRAATASPSPMSEVPTRTSGSRLSWAPSPTPPDTGPTFFNGSVDDAWGNLPSLSEADTWMSLELSAGGSVSLHRSSPRAMPSLSSPVNAVTLHLLLPPGRLRRTPVIQDGRSGVQHSRSAWHL